MGTLGVTIFIAGGVQGGKAKATDAVVVGLVIAALALIAVLLYVYVRKHPRRSAPVTDQWRALAVMGELCPHGWDAQIKLFGWGAPVPEDAPAARVPLVELEWKQYAEEPGRVAVVRRVWARTIPEALQLMVDDRRADITLEEIEHAASGDEHIEWDD
ncbi:MAG TPA: hypothetical protein VK774_09610 [Solirubrobacteraceae bacterium]|jgi:hypothetical protein|nr:hypothetical protein [Solirubrobacteraceae bacterium]